jgi:hypothetical protein
MHDFEFVGTDMKHLDNVERIVCSRGGVLRLKPNHAHFSRPYDKGRGWAFYLLNSYTMIHSGAQCHHVASSLQESQGELE